MSDLRIDPVTIAPRHTLAKSVNGMSSYQTQRGETGVVGGGRKVSESPQVTIFTEGENGVQRNPRGRRSCAVVTEA
jgi:hypothetical protein